MSERFSIGEIVKYQLEEGKEEFKITLQGSAKYIWLIVDKIEEITFTEEDLHEHECK